MVFGRFLPWLTLSFALSLGAAPVVVSLDSGEQLIGELLTKSTDETVYVRSSVLGELSIPRARVLTILPREENPKVAEKPKPRVKPAPKPDPAAETAAGLAEERRIVNTLKEFKAPDDWSGNMRFGVNLSQGDRRWTETYLRGKLEIKPKQSPHYYRLTGSYTYRESERSNGSSYKSTDKYDAEFIYRRSFWENWFVQNAMGGRVDQIKGIDRELQEAVGIGYNFKPSSQFELLFGGGGGIEEFQADYEDSRAGLHPLMNVFQEATWRPLKRTSFVQKFNYYWNPEEFGQFNYVFTAAVRVRLTDLLGFEFSYNKSFDNDVGNGDARDDVQWRNALVVYF